MLAIVAALIALTVRIAAAEPIAGDEVIDELESGELDNREIDELLAEASDELTDDQLEELGLDADAIDGDWLTSEVPPEELARPHSPFGRVDLSLAYRRTDPLASERRDELLVVGTWRR